MVRVTAAAVIFFFERGMTAPPRAATIEEIAAELELSPYTVRFHRRKS